jgi:hypothetical protein
MLDSWLGKGRVAQVSVAGLPLPERAVLEEGSRKEVGGLGTKQQSVAAALACAFSPDKMGKGVGGGERALERESRSSPYVFLILT